MLYRLENVGITIYQLSLGNYGEKVREGGSALINFSSLEEYEIPCETSCSSISGSARSRNPFPRMTHYVPLKILPSFFEIMLRREVVVDLLQ